MADGPEHALTCAWCGAPIARRGRRGPAPTYCPGSSCRVAAHRARAGYREWSAGRPQPLPPAATGAQNVPPVDQVATAVLEAQALAAAFARLGGSAPPPLAWRCSRLGRLIAHGIDRFFPDERSR